METDRTLRDPRMTILILAMRAYRYGIHSTTADEASEPEANVKEEEKK